MSQDLSNATLFEVSWEVCNKVGGIYAVVSSKILEALAAFGENYFLLGPDLGNNPDFEETDEPCWQELRQETDRRNLSCRFGRWNIPGRPKVILVGYRDRYDQSQLLFSLWNRYGVDSISGGWDYVEPVMFSTACGEVIEAACKALHIPADGPALAHFHEWMCGGGLLYLKTNAPYVGTVFTTHATMLGRSMAGSGFDIYKQMHQINPKHEAGAYNITAKCSMETASAREADCFTTVSRITVAVSGTEKELNQLILQTERLEVTRQVFVLNHENALERELLLLKVAADVHNRAELREVGSIYKAKIIDLSPDSMVFELIGKPEKIDAFLKMFADYTILELCRTGVTALERGGMHQHIQKPPQEVRDAQLPLPGTTCH